MKELKPALLFLFIITLVCGGIYPAVVTGIATTLFPKQAGGSFVVDKNNEIRGSDLIGQPFSEGKYFWPRPSATADFGYNPLASGGSNLGPTNPDLIKSVGDRIKGLRDSGVAGAIPVDLVEASASGLDPDISPDAAYAQIARIARARGMTEEALAKVVAAHMIYRQWGVLGQPRVNVLLLNLALDDMHQ